MEHWRRVLGETFSGRFYGPGELVFISDPPSLKALFAADRVNTIAPGRNIILRPLLGPGSLLLQEGEEHLRRRKLMLPPFHGERMRAYESVIAEATERAIASWPQGEEFALHPSMQAITLEVILRAVFGVEDAERRGELRDGLVEILGATASPVAVGLIAPGTRRLPMYRRLNELRQRTDEVLYAEIAERRRDSEAGARDDILSLLVTARFEDGSAMDDTELRDQLMTLLLAGHETTATGLAWAFDLLLHHPEALERLRAELEAGERGYLDAVVNESLRVRPVVPFTGRELRASGRARRLRAAGRHRGHGRNLSRAHPRRRLRRAVRVPPRALPGRRRARDLRLDSLRRRHAALHRRRVRPVRDEGRDRDRSPLGPHARCLLVARAPGAPQRHALPGQRDAGADQLRRSSRARTSGTCSR